MSTRRREVAITSRKRVKPGSAGELAPEFADEAELVRRLRAGDEAAFAIIVGRHHAAMVRLARGYVRSRAEESAQQLSTTSSG